MWFKNLFLLRFTQPFALDPEQLNERLETKAFRPVGPVEPAAAGWETPLGTEDGPLVHAANGFIMICLRREERIMPAAAVREVVDSRAADIEAETGRRLRGKARAALRDEVVVDMLPRAFTRNSRLYGYIDPNNGWLIIDTSSQRQAEEFTLHLRQVLESLPVEPPAVSSIPTSILTAWLQSGRLPEGFALKDECDLRDPDEDGGVIRARKQDLSSNEIRVHLDAGKQVTRLAVEFEERLSFVLDENLIVRRLKFLDLVKEEADLAEPDSQAAQFDSDFAIMTLELSRLLPSLMNAFGGERAPEGARNAA